MRPDGERVRVRTAEPAVRNRLVQRFSRAPKHQWTAGKVLLWHDRTWPRKGLTAAAIAAVG